MYGLSSDDICEKTGRRHIPDWSSVSIEYDGDEAYVDVACEQCGRSGCVGVVDLIENNISW